MSRMFAILALLIYAPLVSADITIGHNFNYRNSFFTATGLSSPGAVCDATSVPENWEGTTGTFKRTGSATTLCSLRYTHGHCTAELRPGVYKNYTGVHRNYYCSSGYESYGSSCKNVVCVRQPNSVDLYSSAGKPDLSCGNPVNVGTGNKYQSEIDLISNGLGQLRIERAYNSYPNPELIEPITWIENLGRWTFFYTQQLKIIEGDTNIDTVFAFRPDGGLFYFIKSGAIWNGEDSEVTQLEEISDGQGLRIGWRYIEADQSVEEYDLDGKLLLIADRNGNTQTLTYNATSGLLEQVDTNTGDYLTFTHDIEDRIATINDNSSPTKTWTYQYDANGNLELVTFPDATVKQYHYEDLNFPHALTGITDEKGIRFAIWNYDSSGRAITSEHAGGVENHTFVYNADGSTTITNPLGKDTTYHFIVLHGLKKLTQVEGHASTNCLAANQDYTYDTNGFLTSKTDWNGNSTTYIPDARGLETSRTEASGTPEARTVTTEWHTTYRTPTKITEPGLETSFTHDGSGNVLTRTLKDLATNDTRITTWTYSTLGQVLTEDGPRTDVTDVTTMAYHICTTGSECGQVHTITNALGHVSTISQYNEFGQPTHVTDENGTPIVITYDSRQRLTNVLFDGTFSTTLAYDNAGLVTRITAPNGSFLDYEYDDAQRHDAIEDALGNRIEYTLDNAGNRTKIDVKDSAQVLRNTQTVIYDELSRMIGTIGANSQTVDYGYDPNYNLTSITEGSNPASANQFNALNNLIQVTDADSGITQYDYDGQNRVTTVTDPNSLVTTYTYNGFGDRLTTDSPDTGLTVVTYDEAGNVDTQTDARSKLTTHTYDALNRRTLSTYTDSSLNITYTYDDTTSGNEGIGNLTGITDGSGSTSYTYDTRGLITNVSTVIGTTNYAIDYGYDSSGQITSITYPSGRVVDYTYNTANQITQVSTTKDLVTTVLADTFTYEPFGPAKSMNYGNGLSALNTYDQDYRATSLFTGSVLNRSYLYDGINNIDSITDGLTSANNQTLDYDVLNRLTDATGAYGDFDYAYDATGNRSSLTLNGTQVDTYNYTTGTHHLDDITGTNPQTFAYDLAGNTTTRNTVTQVFDDRGRMSQSTLSGVTTDYLYNALGQRAEKSSQSSTTQFLYSLQGQLLVEESGNSGIEYAYLNGQPVAAWYTQTSLPTTQLNISVNTDDDDAEEKSNGQMKLADRDFNIVELRGAAQTLGIRLQNVTIPVGAQITNAYVQFDAKKDGSGSMALSIQAEDIGNAPAITSSSSNLSNRTATTASVAWNPPAWTKDDAGPDQQTSDISTVLQEVVDRGDWVSGNSAVLLITGTGERIAHSHNSSATKAPELVVTYSVGGPTVTVDQYYFHTDHLGTPQVMTDDTQTVVWEADYKPFGDTTITVASIENNLRFPGQYFDSESGLNYNYFRYYDPGTGRYITPDPIGVLPGLAPTPELPKEISDRYQSRTTQQITAMGLNHTYGYVGGNPINFVDPKGLLALIPGLFPNNPAQAGQCPANSNSDKEKNCRALYDTIIQSCWGISNPRKRQRCFEAAKATYESCMSEN